MLGSFLGGGFSLVGLSFSAQTPTHPRWYLFKEGMR